MTTSQFITLEQSNDCDEKNSQCVPTDNDPSNQPKNNREINRCTELITSLPYKEAIEIGFAIAVATAAKNDIAPETLIFLLDMQIRTAIKQGAFK